MVEIMKNFITIIIVVESIKIVIVMIIIFSTLFKIIKMTTYCKVYSQIIIIVFMNSKDLIIMIIKIFNLKIIMKLKFMKLHLFACY